MHGKLDFITIELCCARQIGLHKLFALDNNIRFGGIADLILQLRLETQIRPSTIIMTNLVAGRWPFILRLFSPLLGYVACIVSHGYRVLRQ